MILTENQHIVNAIAPDADVFSGTVGSDVIDVKNFSHVTFLVQKGVGATGTQTLTVLACDDTTPTTTSAIPFKYRACTSGDTFGALTDATTAGFATTAGSNQMYAIEVDISELGDTGYNYLQLNSVEVVDSPVDGGVLAILSGPRYAKAVFESVID